VVGMTTAERAAAMTESRGRVARWSAAALAAPVAAGLFAGTTAWASSHDPLHPDGAAPQPPAPSTTEDPSLAALRTQLDQQTAALQRLSAQVAAVRAQAAAMGGGAGAAKGGKVGASGSRTSGGSAGHTTAGSGGSRSSSSGHSGGGTSTSSGGGSGSGGSGGSSGGGGSTTKPAPSPPPTQGGTGASGAPK
jgi:hypothetical protein